MRAAMLDTGPIVGLLHAGDAHHDRSVSALKESASQGRALCTTWETIGEAYTLIRLRLARPGDAGPALVVLRWARESGVVVMKAGDSDHARAAAILEEYGDHPLSYVDAIVLALTERHRVEEVITVDQRNFGPIRLDHDPSITVV
ncbi:MAG: type II toxin-antitoxin system VapC family toxin [Candidatus Dormibacteria bacterium]